MSSAKREEVKEWVRWEMVNCDTDDTGHVRKPISEVRRVCREKTGHSGYIVNAAIKEMEAKELWVQYDPAYGEPCVYMNVYTETWQRAHAEAKALAAERYAAYVLRVTEQKRQCILAKAQMERIQRVFARFGVDAMCSVYTNPQNHTAGKSLITFDGPDALSTLAGLLERVR